MRLFLFAIPADMALSWRAYAQSIKGMGFHQPINATALLVA